MRLYAITGRLSLPLPHRPGRLSRAESEALLTLARAWSAAGVEWIQVREKDLPSEDILALARDLAGAIRGTATRLLLNAAAERDALEAAARAGVGGLHLPSGWTAAQVESTREALNIAGIASPAISVSCHTCAEATEVRRARPDMALFAPVFGKALPDAPALPGQGVAALAEFCRAASPVPVFAMGGVTAGNASACVEAGAAGVAAIRLFHSADWRQLRR